ncbi:MAG: PGPGW domain-containing protein [Phycisphaerales bacterium]|nr:PGPGW domain-containing protein [Phycisphaerales bacterium]
MTAPRRTWTTPIFDYARAGPTAVYRTARKVAVAIIGGTVLLLGIIMIVTPGPAVVVIPAGLAILATEFAWAAWMLRKLRERAAKITGQLMRRTETLAHTNSVPTPSPADADPHPGPASRIGHLDTPPPGQNPSTTGTERQSQ